MEAELRAQLTAEGYVHEVLAEFGTQEKGVFDKDKLDAATKYFDYAYMELDFFQKKKLQEENKPEPLMFDGYTRERKAPANIFRTMGVFISLCSPEQKCLENKLVNCWKLLRVLTLQRN